MSATALTLAAVLALAADPRCGAAPAGSEFASRLAAIAIHESGGDPLVIGVNADRARGLPAAAIRSTTPQEAATRAAALLAQGRSIDLGLMQVNSGQLARHGLIVETAFDACRSMAAGADHYAADVQAVWNLAHRRYNTGGTEHGAAYAAGVEQVLARVRNPAIQIAGPYRAPATPEDTVAPEPPRPPPGMEDALHAGPPVPDDAADLVDAFHRPSSVSPKEPAP
jgi:type IV secretion system protein VirB1